VEMGAWKVVVGGWACRMGPRISNRQHCWLGLVEVLEKRGVVGVV
jgi:hypothetical protein